jgi:hypothetical protein
MSGRYFRTGRAKAAKTLRGYKTFGVEDGTGEGCGHLSKAAWDEELKRRAEEIESGHVVGALSVFGRKSVLKAIEGRRQKAGVRRQETGDRSQETEDSRR